LLEHVQRLQLVGRLADVDEPGAGMGKRFIFRAEKNGTVDAALMLQTPAG
jgi:hypothetical protein